jgi:hypothetical protein
MGDGGMDDTKRSPIDLPDWLATWPSVIETVRKLEQMNPPDEHMPILRQLATDPRMEGAWAELTKRGRQNRMSDGGLADALGQTLLQAFKSTTDTRTAERLNSVEETKLRLLSESEMLQDLSNELLRSTGAPPVPGITQRDVDQDRADALALLRVASWREDLAAGLPDSPLTARDQQAALAQGIGSDLALFFAEHFGHPSYDIAARIASVATGGSISISAVRAASLAYRRRALALS